MKPFFRLLKTLIGAKNTARIRPLGHGLKAYLAALFLGFPGKKLKLIGVNGTKGKTTTTILIAKILNLVGLKTGFISSALLFDGLKEIKNKEKLSTVDSITLQKIIAQMVKNGCKFAVIEMTSQGLEQRRHLGLGKFDTTVFLNAYPEHLEAHGGWGKYIQAKSLLFKETAKNGFFVGNYNHDQLETTQKLFQSIPFKTRKTVTKDLVNAGEYKSLPSPGKLYQDLEIDSKVYPTNLLSKVEITDLYYAIRVVENYYPSLRSELSTIIPKLQGAPGRMDWVVNNYLKKEVKMPNWKDGVSILVDYAHEPESMNKLLETLNNWKKSQIFTQVIHILSSDGDGRDNWKRSIHGDISQKYADFTIFTTDNYNQSDNPQEILDGLSQNFDLAAENQTYWKFLDRKEAFMQALRCAKDLIEKDNTNKIVIVSTGVGTEWGLTQPSGVMPWYEKDVWADCFDKIT